MQETPVAGTFRLDGMLQGPLPGDDLIVSQIESWVADAAKQGLRFHPKFEGSSFSILGGPGISKTSSLGNQDLAPLMEDALESLLGLFPEDKRSGVFSTLRSEEFRPGCVVQSLYSITSDGSATSEQRTLDIDTEEPPPEITAASIRRFAIITFLALLFALIVSAFFIDYRKLFTEARDQVVPLSKEEVTIDQTALGNVVSVKLEGVDNRRNALVFKLQRGSGWQQALDSKPDESSSWPEFLMHQAVHTRTLRVELYNKKGEILSRGTITLDGLYKKSETEVAVVAKLGDRLAKVVVRP